MNTKNAVYQIRLAGKISPLLINYIDDMQIRQEIGQDTISLVGWLPDQSALLGLLNALNDLHSEILSVNAVNTNMDAHPHA